MESICIFLIRLCLITQKKPSGTPLVPSPPRRGVIANIVKQSVEGAIQLKFLIWQDTIFERLPRRQSRSSRWQGFRWGWWACGLQNKKKTAGAVFLVWRRARDSNPRSGLTDTPLAGARLQPLGQLSKTYYLLFVLNTQVSIPGAPVARYLLAISFQSHTKYLTFPIESLRASLWVPHPADRGNSASSPKLGFYQYNRNSTWYQYDGLIANALRPGARIAKCRA